MFNNTYSKPTSSNVGMVCWEGLHQYQGILHPGKEENDDHDNIIQLRVSEK
jgi:hypothetical protein